MFKNIQDFICIKMQKYTYAMCRYVKNYFYVFFKKK